MLKESFRLLRRLQVFTDTLWIGFSWVAAYWLRFSTGWIPIYFGVPSLSSYLVHLPLVLVVWIAVLGYGGCYRTEEWWHTGRAGRALLRSSALAMALMVSIIYLSTKMEYSRIFYACFWALSLLGLIGSRQLLRAYFTRTQGKRADSRRVLLVGDNDFVASFLEKIRRHPETALVVRGLLLPEGRRGERRGGLVVQGDYGDLGRVVEEEGIDTVVFTLPVEDAWRLKDLLKAIEDSSLDILVIPDVFPIMPLRPAVEDFEGIPLIQVRAGPQCGWAGIEKRVLDLLLSGTALVLLSPLFLTIAVLIKATSKGPVFYRQPRLGMDGREFSIIKFRTMRRDAEKGNQPVWSMRRDPRRTALGAFLRKFSLDELPQLWNVLKGEMSLVGPRPERPEFIREFRRQIPAYLLRQKVKSGLTGLAQVRGWRGATSLEKRVECDIQYIEGWSLGLDMKILWLTLWKGFVNRAEQ